MSGIEAGGVIGKDTAEVGGRMGKGEEAAEDLPDSRVAVRS